MADLERLPFGGEWPGFSGCEGDTDLCWLDGAPVGDWLLVLSRLAEIDGPFALAWTDHAGALHLARDPIGHRSLFWAQTPSGSIVFGNRLLDVLRRRRSRPIPERKSVATFLTYAYVPGVETLWTGVYAVAPGTVVSFRGAPSPGGAPMTEHVLTGAPASFSGETSPATRTFLGGGRPEIRSFWTLPKNQPPDATSDMLQQSLREGLERSVDHCAADVASGERLGATLSGGIDSSAVIALAARRWGPPIALSVSFGPDLPNELEFSSLVASHCGARHRVVEISPSDIKRHFDQTIGRMSEPNGDPLTVPNTLLFAAARDEGIRVLLNGEGGDPCFGGPKNGPMLLGELYGEDSRERLYLRAHQRCYDDLGQMTPADLPRHHLEPLLTDWFNDPRWPTFLDQLMAINIVFKGAWHILPKVEHLSAPYGVRARSPLFSRDIVTLSTRIPSALKRAGSVEKYLFKEAVRDLLPASIVDRPKSGMMVPVEFWFSGPLLPMARERLLEGALCPDFVNRSWMEALLNKKGGGLRPRRGIKIWLLLTLEAHLRAGYAALGGSV